MEKNLVSCPDPTHKSRGSGDFRPIPQASLTLITFHQSHCKKWATTLKILISMPRITIITNNDRDIAPRFMQVITIDVGHDKDCYKQFDNSCKVYNTEKLIFKSMQALKS